VADQTYSYSDQCRHALMHVAKCRATLRDADNDVAEIDLTELIEKLKERARQNDAK